MSVVQQVKQWVIRKFWASTYGEYGFSSPENAVFRATFAEEHGVEQAVEISKLKFIVSQAPMMNMPELSRLGNVGSKFAYVHPGTIADLAVMSPLPKDIVEVSLRGGQTRWILTKLMPPCAVIFSPNAMPGVK